MTEVRFLAESFRTLPSPISFSLPYVTSKQCHHQSSTSADGQVRVLQITFALTEIKFQNANTKTKALLLNESWSSSLAEICLAALFSEGS